MLGTNIAVPSLTTPKRSIHFLPDRVLVRSGRTYAEVSWSSIEAVVGNQRFIESGRVPADAQVVDQTSKYANKNGGPDRRFKDNRQLPIALYGEVELAGANGFRATWQTSRADAARAVASALSHQTSAA